MIKFTTQTAQYYHAAGWLNDMSPDRYAMMCLHRMTDGYSMHHMLDSKYIWNAMEHIIEIPKELRKYK